MLLTEFQALKPNDQIKYTGPSTPKRIRGNEYTVESISGRLIVHAAANGDGQVYGSFADYKLVSSEQRIDAPVETSPIETNTVNAESTPIPTPNPIPTPPTNPVSTQDDSALTSIEGLSTKQLKTIQDKTNEMMTFALKQGQDLAKSMLNEVTARIDEVKSQSTILKVQVNGEAIKTLSTTAVPFLKSMIIRAKIGKNIMLVGPAGCGKTTAAAQLAESLSLTFYHNTVTAGASETWFLGRQTPNGFQPGPLHLAYKLGGVYLADEYDAGDANLLIMFNTMLENGHFYNPFNGETIKRHKDFVFLAACNTFGKGADATYTGRNRIDAASLRRFAGSVIPVNYDPTIEKAVCPDETVRTALQTVRKELLAVSSTEIISTGCIKNTYDLMQQGESFKSIAESLSLSWPNDLKSIMTKAIKSVSSKKPEQDGIPF